MGEVRKQSISSIEKRGLARGTEPIVSVSMGGGFYSRAPLQMTKCGGTCNNTCYSSPLLGKIAER
jgi:hypothetical protein